MNLKKKVYINEFRGANLADVNSVGCKTGSIRYLYTSFRFIAIQPDTCRMIHVGQVVFCRLSLFLSGCPNSVLVPTELSKLE